VLSVGQFTRRIHDVLGAIGRVAVEGEISRLMRAASGHLYFDLKDIDARVGCIVWRSRVDGVCREELREGLQVVVHGRLDVYPPRGTYSLVVDRIEPSGVGALLARLEELKRELDQRGWFERCRPLPPLPRIVGVVTSRDGAALQDFLRTRSLRWRSYPVRLAHTPVQGREAAPRIADAIRRLDASGVDVIVVCRGGGSLEDLWAFNELVVAEAVHAASVPVVSGVGHETDVTLCDFTADHRAHTPTDAAQVAIPARAELEAHLERAGDHLGRALDRHLGARVERFERLRSARVLRRPDWILGNRRERLAQAAARMESASRVLVERGRARYSELGRRIERAHPAVLLERAAARRNELAGRLGLALAGVLETRSRRLDVAATVLEAISPLTVLERGYSITQRRGELRPLQPGDELVTRLWRGGAVSRVERVVAAEAPERGEG